MKLEIFKTYVHLYLTELEQAAQESTPMDYDLAEAKILLTDFVQWLCDDVEDGLLPDIESQETFMQDDGTMIFAPEVEYSQSYGLKIFSVESDEGFKPGEIVAIQAPPSQPVGKSNFPFAALQPVEPDLIIPESPTPGFYKCIKTAFMDIGAEQVFTAGEIYFGNLSLSLTGDFVLCFLDDRGDTHQASGEWLAEHFELDDLSQEESQDE